MNFQLRKHLGVIDFINSSIMSTANYDGPWHSRTGPKKCEGNTILEKMHFCGDNTILLKFY